MIGSPEAISFPSDNFGPRRNCARPDLIVLHYTAMDSAEGARDWLCSPEAEVSAHYVISETGTLWQLVSEDMRAWHAGAGAWGGVEDVNSHSIGIEIANTGSAPFPEPQMAVLEQLLSGIVARWEIPAHRVIGHSDSAIARKIDPGARFDWQRLARRGLSIWPEHRVAELAPEAFRGNCARFGYVAGEGQDSALLNAFRLRFRPWASGVLDEVDCGLAAELARRWPVAQNPELLA